MRLLRTLGLMALCVGAAAPSARAWESYYVVLFGAQRPDVNEPRYAHSFAAFVKATDTGTALRLELTEISWLPTSARVNVLRPASEPGRNFGVRDSLALAAAHGARVSLWGPYQIREELYERAVLRRGQLESGRVRYQAVDAFRSADRVSNCVRALARVAPGTPPRVGIPSWGEPASYFLAHSYRPWIVDPNVTHDWLLAPLGLDDPALVRRGLDDNPCGGILLKAIQNLRNAGLCQPPSRARSGAE